MTESEGLPSDPAKTHEFLWRVPSVQLPMRPNGVMVVALSLKMRLEGQRLVEGESPPTVGSVRVGVASLMISACNLRP